LSKTIILDFMKDNPNHTFHFLTPTKLVLGDDNYINSYFNVIIYNTTTNRTIEKKISPELLYTYYSLGESYKKGKKVNLSPIKTEKLLLKLDSSTINDSDSSKLKKFLSEKDIATLFNYNGYFSKSIKEINTYLIKNEKNENFILPHNVLAIYYYFRFTSLRRAVLECNVENLYKNVICDKNAKIIFSTHKNENDSAFIYRYACDPNAKNAFENLRKYIQSYISYYKKNNVKDVETIYLKVNFPTREEFSIKVKTTRIVSQLDNKTYNYIHEIINDNSTIPFNSLETIIEQFDNQINPDDIEHNKPQEGQNDNSNDSGEISEEKASKKNKRAHYEKEEKEPCESLKGKLFTKSEIKMINDIKNPKIPKENEKDEELDLNTDEASNGEIKIKNVHISTEDSDEVIKNEIDNFKVFRLYIDFLKKRNEIKNLSLSNAKKLPKYIKESTKKANPKCKIDGNPREYIIATFKYINMYVSLVEFQNSPTQNMATWVISSSTNLSESTFNSFLELHFEKNISIDTIKAEHKNKNPKFNKKSHQTGDKFSESELSKWYMGLLSKIR